MCNPAQEETERRPCAEAFCWNACSPVSARPAISRSPRSPNSTHTASTPASCALTAPGGATETPAGTALGARETPTTSTNPSTRIEPTAPPEPAGFWVQRPIGASLAAVNGLRQAAAALHPPNLRVHAEEQADSAKAAPVVPIAVREIAARSAGRRCLSPPNVGRSLSLVPLWGVSEMGV